MPSVSESVTTPSLGRRSSGRFGSPFEVAGVVTSVARRPPDTEEAGHCTAVGVDVWELSDLVLDGEGQHLRGRARFECRHSNEMHLKIAKARDEREE